MMQRLTWSGYRGYRGGSGRSAGCNSSGGLLPTSFKNMRSVSQMSAASRGHDTIAASLRTRRSYPQLLLSIRRSAAYSTEQHVGSFRFLNNASLEASRRRDFHSQRAIELAHPEHKVVPMPALSPTMESGSISKWNLNEGDQFEVGTSICDVETDKATVSFDATDDGYLAKILVREGEINVGQPIMITCEEAEDVNAFANFSLSDLSSSQSSQSSPIQNDEKQEPQAVAPEILKESVGPSASGNAPFGTSNAASAITPGGARIFASPLAKKLARESGVSIEEVANKLTSSGSAGSGGSGRIVAADVMRAASIASATIAPPTSPSTTVAVSAPTKSAAYPTTSQAGFGVYADFQLDEIAQALAARQTYAKQVVPHYYLSVDLDLSKLLLVRDEFNAKKIGTSLSIQDFLVKAAALAMQQVPDVNGAWMDTFIRRYRQVDINLVMGAGHFVATPVLRDVGSRGLVSIAREIAEFEDSLFSDNSSHDDVLSIKNPSSMAVGTFSIHNLGLYGVKSAAPIVLTPQACALALGSITDAVVPSDDDSGDGECWKIAPVMTATLSCDHRVVDGAVGAQWLAAFKAYVEQPMSMLL